jgi:hypothetical protein
VGFTTAIARWANLVRHSLWRRRAARAPRPPDARLDADPWLGATFAALNERYRLGDETAEGFQVLRRTGRERFNPMRLYLRPKARGIAADYDVRIRDGKPVEWGRAVLDSRVGPPLGVLGLAPGRETLEDWGGQVITRRYEGACEDPLRAAEAIRFVCEKSEQIIDAGAE